MRTVDEVLALHDRFWSVGIPAHSLMATNYYYHETLKLPSTITSITGDGSFLPDKPSGALWLSFGVEVNGVVMSDWRDFMVRDMALTTSELMKYTTSRAIFAPLTTYIVLNEENWVNLPKVWDAEAEAFPQHERSSFNYTDREANPRVPWMKLLELGVDAVAIDGRSEREHFYGYDVDSLVVLSADAISGWESVAGEYSPTAWSEYYYYDYPEDEQDA